jgi:hypothetical protein
MRALVLSLFPGAFTFAGREVASLSSQHSTPGLFIAAANHALTAASACSWVPYSACFRCIHISIMLSSPALAAVVQVGD